MLKRLMYLSFTGDVLANIQAPDVSWNKPFKAYVTEMYVKWLAEEGINQYTTAGKASTPPFYRKMDP